MSETGIENIKITIEKFKCNLLLKIIKIKSTDNISCISIADYSLTQD